MIPVTVIGGYLGAGKTTLINRILGGTAEPLAVLVNDFGALNIDAELISVVNGSVMELTNGCVCCTIQDDLGGALESIRGTNVKHVIIEASGVALPQKVARYGQTWPGFRAGGVSVVVDVVNIQRLRGDKFVKHLVEQQLSEADLLLLAKTDLIDPPPQITGYGVPTVDLRNLADFEQLLRAPSSPNAARSEQRRKHVHFTATEFTQPVPLEPVTIRRFLGRNPQVRRAKGWFSDGNGDHWLLQAVSDTCTIDPADPHPTSLVFIHLADTQIDLECLLTGD